MNALENAQCMDIIEKFPQGIDTIIGTEGEQQRIAIARVMLKDSSIVILDEATAFADPDNESKVQTVFKKLTKGRTVIMIAHRLSTIIHVDRIFVMKEGRIFEQGTHSQLDNGNGLYKKMWQGYKTSLEWKVGKEVVR